MAKILNKDPVTYQKERDGFLRELHHFHDGRGTPFRQVPRLHGHEVDLYLLYVLVTAHGGWEKVNQRAEWDVLLEQFSLPSSCVNGGIALKQIYIRYLERYERVHFMGEVGDQEEDAEDAHNRRWSVRAIHNVPLTYNHHHHNISDTVRSNVGLSTKLFKATEYDRLALSLLSPLPNEQDYAINVCTLLSNEGKHTLKLDRCPRLVDFLLAHAGVFAEASLRDVFMDMYKRAKNQSTRRFWADVIEEKDFLELTDPPPVKEFSNYCLPPTPSSLPDNLLDSESVLGELSKCIEELPDRTSPPSTKPPSVVPESENTDDCAMVDLSEVPSAEMPSEVQTDPPEPVVLDTSNRMDVADDEQTVEESKPDGEIKPEVVKPESEESEKPVEVEEVKVEKPKIRMIDVPEDEIPQLPKQESKSLFWCEPVDYSKLDALIDFGQFERDFLCLGRGLGVDDLLGQRVLQVATILRNLSFEEDNIPVLTKNLSFMRFALMCMQSKWNRLSQMGLDMLSQVAGEMVLEDPQTDTLAAMFLSTVTKGLSSPDRFMIISCLEIINKLSQNEVNEELMLKVIEQKVYDQVCTFLTLHDIMLLIYTLECLYSLSSLGEKACNSICRVHGAIDTLVSLITVEAQSYGPRACILMRVVERVPEQGGVIHPSSSSTVINTPTGAVQAPQLTQLTTMNATPAAQTTVITKQIITPQRPIQAMPQQSSGTTTIVIQAPSPQIAQQQQQQQIQENEQFVMAWLRTNYEIAVGATVDQNEIYHQYLAACSKVGKRGVPSFQFSRFVRTVFGGSVGPNPKPNAASGASQEYQYVGIKVRASAVPLVVASGPVASQQQPTPSPAPATVAENAPITPVASAAASDPALNAPSPILKAQLSAPSKSGVKVDSKSQVMAHPHLTQALLGNAQHQAQRPSSGPLSPANTSQGAHSTCSNSQPSPSSSTPNTSLIKSLLASKVNTAPTVTSTSVVESMSMLNVVTTSSATNITDAQQPQVAQRQQRLMQQQLQSGQQTTAPASASVSTTTKPVTKTADSTEQPVVIPKVNGTRGLLSPELQAENSMDTTDNLSKSNTLLPPPPPKSTKIDEDSNSAASTANSIISSGGGLSTDGDGDNSLTSFEGILLNGMPHNLDIDNESTEEIKPTNGNLEKPKAKGMLADLLEKKVATKEPIINGIIGKELRISEKGLELVENSLDDTNQSAEQTKQGLKRPAPTATPPQEAKKICLNGEVKAENETPEAKSEPENSSEVASTTENTATTTSAAITTQAPVLMAAPRQIIVAQGGIQPGQVVFTQASGMPMKTQVIVQQAGQRPMLVQNQQPMLINSTVGGGQQLLLTQNNGQTYVVAPSQGLSQGQTFLLAQNQQQGSNQKTIIILHQQGQKVGTPGQPMMVQLPRSAIQGGASGLQNLMFTQGSGGQMTVTLPGCNPIIARPVDPANGGAQQVIKVVTPARPATPASTSATVTTSAGVTANSTSASSTPTSTTTTTATPAPITVTLPVSPFVCEWRGCMRIFKSANEVYMHACQSHCPTGPEDVQCLWERCDNLKRKRFSLMTHLYDRHCNNETMKAMAVRRKQMAMSGKSEIPAPAPPPPHPGYAPNAALHAIKRHALEFVNPKELMQRTAAAGTAVASTATTSVTSSTPDAAPPPPSIKIGAAAPQVTQIIRPTQQPAETNPSRRLSFQDDNEGPVTKSIRLTSSLILRNLVIYSNTGKRHLRSYEPHLASIALSNVESSRTIAQVLYDMNQASNQS
ncbi:AT-rich interactive domain-containing protein 2 isoform X3 [Neocloeon triangulifer]|uniref:AT-rich interactive domain-containing protein 2 isoform X3 n=1 Tax=Neocloeon triangulifer TaxID=2078957 RepID=UPI00286EF0C4|nr:AT-rich interactive domain-containing protein 2 isoform X3 [Neocloeon triangulifer]